MLAILVNVDIFLIAALVFTAAIIGYLVRSSRIKSLNIKIAELEKEVLASHAEILQLQRDKIDIIKTINEPASPVISISANKEDKGPEKLPDGPSRKLLLSTGPVVKQQSGS
jgi:hypothetical protein